MKRKYKLFRDTAINNPNNKPVSGIAFTVGYIVVCIFIVIGVPAPHTGSSNPIPPEDLPTAIIAFVVLYFLIIALLIIMEKIRKKIK